MKYLPDDTIPKPLYDALVGSDDDYGDEVRQYLSTKRKEVNLSVTSLNQPTQKLILSKRHAKDIYIEPLKDCWHSFMGSVAHWVLEKYAARNPNYITEFRMGVDLTISGKKCHIHGKFDLYNREEKALEDWKLTNASNMLYPKTAFEKQLNILRYILKKNDYEVKALRDIYLFPHLDKQKANKPGYPSRHAKVVDVKIEHVKEVRKYIEERVSLYIENEEKKDKDLTPCTDEDRWIRGTLFKVFLRKKTGGKKGEVNDFSSKAAHYSESYDEIVQLTETVADKDKRIVEIKGEANHCNFCKAAPFCHQYQKEQLKKK